MIAMSGGLLRAVPAFAAVILPDDSGTIDRVIPSQPPTTMLPESFGFISEILAAYGGLAWLMLAVLLCGTELLVPGIFLVFIALAAAITGVVTLALPALPDALQLVSFGVWSCVTVVIGQRWYHQYPARNVGPRSARQLSQLIGATVTVAEPIRNGEGRVSVGEGIWTANGPDSPLGTSLVIVDIRDGKLVVGQPASIAA